MQHKPSCAKLAICQCLCTFVMPQPNLGYSDGYKYAHSYAGNFVEQEFLPAEISGTVLYVPQDNPRERELRKNLREKWKEKYGY